MGVLIFIYNIVQSTFILGNSMSIIEFVFFVIFIMFTLLPIIVILLLFVSKTNKK